MKVAIVHDWLVGGGAELVVLELHKMFPDAPIYTSYCTDEWRKRLDGKVVTGYLQNFGRIRKLLPPLRATWFSRLNLDGYDLVISSSGAEAKGIRVGKNTKHVNYCHAPTHYYWSRYDEYLQHPGWGPFDFLGRLGLKLLVGPLRRWDYKAAQRPDVMLANSTHTQSEIKKYYGRDSVVVHPPVDVPRFADASADERHGFIITGRHTPYKRFDLAVAACTELGLPLKVLGDGPDTPRLRALAGPTIEFLGKVPHDEVPKHVGSAEAFLFPGLDDFGISAVEALAAGTPVIAYKAAGALDYVNDKTGLFFEEQTLDSLVEVLRTFDSSKFSSTAIQKSSQQFSVAEFQKKIRQIVQAD